MRRKNREVVKTEEIFDILLRCDTIRVCMQGEEYPYAVPVSFGAERKDESITVYFHCAKQGMKVEMLKNAPNVCIEGDIFYKTETTDYGITARYESVIGFGTCEWVQQPEEIRKALCLLTEHYGYRDYPIEKCAASDHLLVGKCVLKQVTGKRNLPQSKDVNN